MTLWRYIAIPVEGNRPGARRSGELSASTAADVRASLRRIGLQAIDVRPIRRRLLERGDNDRLQSLVQPCYEYVRGRRRHERAELYDALSTLLSAGIPLVEAIDTISRSVRGRSSALRSMLALVSEQLHNGSSFADAMEHDPWWFDPTEVAMVRAGQLAGSLTDVLQSLAARHERAAALSSRLAGALAYPAVVFIVGVGVVIFLSTKTLPQLVQVLQDSSVETPGLTAFVMGLGQLLARHWLVGAIGCLLVAAITVSGLSLARRSGVCSELLSRLIPTVVRRLAVARFSLQLAELLKSGVPMVESLRVLCSTSSIQLDGGLNAVVRRGADEIERGEELSAALSDERWFDEEFRRLLDVGQASGELESMLERIGERYLRQSQRLIDRLAALLEPAVIVVLAVMVGTVVMAAILPLLRLQEIL